MSVGHEDPLFEALRQSGRIAPDLLPRVQEVFIRAGTDPVLLAHGLNELNVISRYQHRKISTGRAFELLFGNYLIISKIGEGGMGKVYHAALRPDGIAVALKVVRSHLLSNKVVMKRYEREAHAAKALVHPNIVKLIDAGETGGKYFLAMEFVDGSDLSRLVKEFGPLPYPEACEYIRQASLGLQHAHDLRFVHRDIKPSNMLVSGTRAALGTEWNAVVKILDMGLVRSLENEDASGNPELTRDGTVVGTPDYMSPEQGKNSSIVDSRADLYSLGCTLYYLIRGQPPYPRGTPIDKLIAHQIDPVPDLRADRPDIPPMLADVVSRLLRKKPDERYSSALEVAKALEPFTPQALKFDLTALELNSPYYPVDLAPTSPITEVTPIVAPMTAEAVTTTPPPQQIRDAIAVAEKPSAKKPRPATPVAGPKSLPPTIKPPASKPKKIPKAADTSSSGSLPGSTDAPSRTITRSSSRKKKRNRPKKAPLALLIAGGTVLLVMAIVVAIVATRSAKGPETSNTTPTTPAPVAPAAEPRPLSVLLPDHTDAVLLFRGQVLRERLHTLGWPTQSADRKLLDLLKTQSRFDPRECDRGFVAFRALPEVVLAGGTGFPKDWLADWDELQPAARNEKGIRTFQNPKKFQTVVLPDPPTLLTTSEPAALDRLMHRLLVEVRPPAELTTDLRNVVREYDDSPDPPALLFHASGDWKLPNSKREKLSSRGITSLKIVAALKDQLEVELSLVGKNRQDLLDFVNVDLPALVKERYPSLTPFASSFLKSASRIDLHTQGYILTARVQWSVAEFQSAIAQAVRDHKSE